MKPFNRLFVFAVLVCSLLASCGAPSTGGSASAPASSAATSASTAGDASSTPAGGDANTITLAAYTTPREAYAKIIPLFKQQWKEKTGQDVTFEESYQASGAQSRAIVEGFNADIAALSLKADVEGIAGAGLITHD